jgi:hypothetical protein
MGRGSAAFVFKVDSNINISGSELKEIIKNKIMTNIRKPGNTDTGRGFINLNVGNTELPIQKMPEVYILEKEKKLISLYREYTSTYDKFDGIHRSETNDIYILYDLQNRLLILRTSDSGDANKLIKFFVNREDKIRFRPPNYVNDEIFFRWIITNAKNGRSKLPDPCKLQNIDGAYIKDFQDSDQLATTESLNIRTVEDLSEDNIYKQVKDVGERTYVKGKFLHERWMYSIRIYKNGKITLGKRPPNVEDNVFDGMFGVAFEEMENIYRFYSE